MLKAINQPNKQEIINRFLQEADYFLSSYIGVATRLQIIDYSASFHNGPFGCIVPYPKVKWDIQASLKPFTYVVRLLNFGFKLLTTILTNKKMQSRCGLQ